MTSFETITPEEYKILVDNEKKIFDLTENFTTLEILINIDTQIKMLKIKFKKMKK